MTVRALVVGDDTGPGGIIAAGLRSHGYDVATLPSTSCRTPERAAADVADVSAGLRPTVVSFASAGGGNNTTVDPPPPADIAAGLDALVIAAWDPLLAAPRPIRTLTDADIEAGWEGSMQTMIWSLQALYPALVARRGRVVVVLPTTAMSGGRNYTLAAAAFEGQRVLMKATARQWGPSGVRVNALAVAPEMVLDDVAAAGVHYLAPAALGDDRTDEVMAAELVSAVAFLLGDASAGLTGQTIGIDGGRWLMP